MDYLNGSLRLAYRMMVFSVEQSFQTRAGTPRRFRPPQSLGRYRRSVLTAQDRPVLERPALRPAFASFSCSRPISRLVSQPLADDAAQCTTSALYVINAKRDPFVVSEIKLGKVALQVLFANVVVPRLRIEK